MHVVIGLHTLGSRNKSRVQQGSVLIIALRHEIRVHVADSGILAIGLGGRPGAGFLLVLDVVGAIKPDCVVVDCRRSRDSAGLPEPDLPDFQR
jgi:hypothetical protein